MKKTIVAIAMLATTSAFAEPVTYTLSCSADKSVPLILDREAKTVSINGHSVPAEFSTTIVKAQETQVSDLVVQDQKIGRHKTVTTLLIDLENEEAFISVNGFVQPESETVLWMRHAQLAPSAKGACVVAKQ